MDIWKNSILDRGKTKCKVPEVRACLAYSRKSKEAKCGKSGVSKGTRSTVLKIEVKEVGAEKEEQIIRDF